MNSRELLPVLALVIVTLFAAVPVAQAQMNRVTFPDNFNRMVAYGDYRRGDGGELAYALPETLQAAKTGQPLPVGTHIVLEIYKGGTLTDYFVMAKGEGWGLDYPEEQRTGDWHFQQYNPERQVRRTSFADRCMACHQGAGAASEFMFSHDRLLSYIP